MALASTSSSAFKKKSVEIWDKDLPEEGADLVVRSSDLRHFGTRKAFLRAASSVMEDMLDIGDDEQS